MRDRIARYITVIPALLGLISMAFYQSCNSFLPANVSYDGASLTEDEKKAISSPGFSPPTLSGLRPLSKAEIMQSLETAFGFVPEAAASLEDSDFVPFGNNTEKNMFGEHRIGSLQFVAWETGKELSADSGQLVTLLPCFDNTPDATCIRSFLQKVLPLAFRGKFSGDILEQYSELANSIFAESNNFEHSIETLTATIIMDPFFLYRWEEGEKVKDNLYRLNDSELLSKISFFLHGSPPSSEMIQRVNEGALLDKTRFEQFLDEILEDPKALDVVDLFHAAWLGYVNTTDGGDGYMSSARKETRSLLEKVVFRENTSWHNVLISKETYVDGVLAEAYGMDAPPSGEWRWQAYESGERRGLLSHASFLSVGRKFGDTSPTMRGYNVQKALFCGDILAPPPDVDPDEPLPAINPDDCKEDRYRGNTLANKSCAGCHQMMDVIGFGLENFDSFGRFRETEPGRNDCHISGNGQATVLDEDSGQVTSLGDFRGPAQLADLAIRSGYIDNCLLTRLVEFDVGNSKHGLNRGTVLKLLDEFRDNPNLKSIIKKYVMMPEFRFRRDFGGE